MKISFLFSLCLIVGSCAKAPKTPATCDFTNSGNDYFTIVSNDDSPERAFNVFCKKVNVFGVTLYATSTVSDQDLLHAANIMAQYLDNDEDSIIDNPLVLDEMIENQSSMVLFGTENSKDQRAAFNSARNIEDQYKLQDLYGSEIHPNWNYDAPFDATFEEVLHLITHSGYSQVYPSVFGEQQGSEIANAMDLARGGQFTSIPSNYSSDAWYSYDDRTCEYDCQVTEYFYWALTSLLGAQNYPDRLDEIGHEWKANTPALVQSLDPAVYAILTDTAYLLPTVIPDGSYLR
jgi:hypothetical protein